MQVSDDVGPPSLIVKKSDLGRGTASLAGDFDCRAVLSSRGFRLRFLFGFLELASTYGTSYVAGPQK